MGWHVGFIGMGVQGFRSGLPVAIPGAPLSFLTIMAFRNSLFGFLEEEQLFGGQLRLYEVNGSNLGITLHGTTDYGTYGSVEVTSASAAVTRASLTDTVAVALTRIDDGVIVSLGFSVITRSGTTFSVGGFNAQPELASIQDFGLGARGLTRIDDTHFAFRYNRGGGGPYGGEHIAIYSVSGTTVTQESNTSITPVSATTMVTILDSSHLMAHTTDSPGSLHVYTFTIGGGISATATFSLSGAAPPSTVQRLFGVQKSGTPDFTLQYTQNTGVRWLQPCTWTGSGFTFGTALALSAAPVLPGTPYVGDVGGSLDRHMLLHGTGFGACFTQSGASALLIPEVKEFTIANAENFSSATLHSNNIAVVTGGLYLQACQC